MNTPRAHGELDFSPVRPISDLDLWNCEIINSCFVTQLVVIVAAGTRRFLHQFHQHSEVQILSTTAEGGIRAGL